MRFPGFIGPSYTLASVNVDCQRCVNFYPEINETGRGKEQEVASLVATPGMALLTTVGSGPNRCEFVASNGQYFVVSGNKFYRLDENFDETELGTLNTSSGPVSMADNGFEIMIVDGDNGYTWTFATSLFAQITDPDFTGADQVAFLSTRFVYNIPGTGRLGYTEPNSTTIEGDFADAGGSADNLVGLTVNNLDLWLFGSKSIEIFYTTEDLVEPFQRIQGAYVEHGLTAPFSIAKMNNTVYWLGQDEQGAGVVYRARGYQPERISTHAIEQAIQQYDDLTTATAYTYQQNGHYFYALNFVGASTTWVFDSTSGMWHERVSFSNGEENRHRAETHAFVFGKHVVGDYQNGNLYELSLTTYTDNGDVIRRRRVAPHLSAGLKRAFYSAFQLDAETGVGLDGTGQGTDPQVVLEWSDDGGHSWSNEKWQSLGQIGQTKRRAIWRRLGSSRDRVYRITYSEPTKCTLIGAELTFEVGAA